MSRLDPTAHSSKVLVRVAHMKIVTGGCRSRLKYQLSCLMDS